MSAKRSLAELPVGGRKALNSRKLEIHSIRDSLDREKRQPMRLRQSRHRRRLHLDGGRVIGFMETPLFILSGKRRNRRQHGAVAIRAGEAFTRPRIYNRRRLHNGANPHPRHTRPRPTGGDDFGDWPCGQSRLDG